MISLEKLINCILTYDPCADIKLIKKAFFFGQKAHKGQIRYSGEDFFTHPVKVAELLAQMKLDSNTIAAGLLHDILEDTNITYDEILKEFGSTVTRIVDGVTKISGLNFKKDSITQAENFRKFVLAFAEDIRVLFVKICDRLHNMRTLHFVESEEKRKRIAQETYDIYIPLSQRMGLYHIYNELDDLALKTLTPEIYYHIEKKREKLYRRFDNTIDRVILSLQKHLKTLPFKTEASGRFKSISSIWHKIKKQNLTFEQLSDIMAFRIICDDIPECYQILGLLHKNFYMVPGKFKDYISTPKSNHYQSLHTTLIMPRSGQIEIQIRTDLMHKIAEFGVASHWHYKIPGNIHDNKIYTWIKNVLEIIKSSKDTEQFFEHTKLELYRDEIFCFTPSDDLIALKRGATALDFAYAIHEDIGSTAISAVINGKNVSLRTPLKTGMYIEIIKNPNPITTQQILSPYLKSGKARLINKNNNHSEKNNRKR